MGSIKTNWFDVIENSQITSPGLLISSKLIKANIEAMIRLSGNVDRLWPHIKTYKMAQIIELQKEHQINKFKCATISEAELLCESKVSHVLLAIQPTEKKLRAFLNLQLKNPEIQFSTLVDNTKSLEIFEKITSKNSQSLKVWIDINNGMNRTGIVPDKKAFNLYQKIKNISNIHFLGLHLYDGHIRIQNEKIQKESTDNSFLKVADLRQKIESIEKSKIDVIAGGSPTFLPHSQRKDVFLSPGTTLLWDQGYDKLWPKSPFEIAAVLATRIISKPKKNVLCFDLGHKAVASEMTLPRVTIIGLEKANHVGQNEEHLILETKEAEKYDVGDLFYALPKHICPTVAKYNQAQVINNQNLVEYWEIKGKNYQYDSAL